MLFLTEAIMNRFTVLLSIACFALAQGASTARNPLRPWWNAPSSTTGQRIVGGFEIDILDAPFQVSLQRGGHFCGGSIIGEQWVLTAAHCASDRDGPKLQVRVGSSRHASGGQLVKVKRAIQHPNYNGQTIDYDYTLLELAQPVQLSEEFYAVGLPEQDEPVEDGQLLQVSGWGNTQSAQESSKVLRATNVPAVNQEVCREEYKNANKITDRMICAGYKAGGKDACQGDSGGPLVAGNTLVGVVSWGMGCAQPNYSGVYSRVAAVRDWIKEHSGI
ncbi:hypothetical protein pipiens_015204 [Culex pipiens pipiens]|uniref:trypsin n=1 Tax=Culex pipiens pipiens TaxID=38569 RepID=A0ABD1CRI9_CULPP